MADDTDNSAIAPPQSTRKRRKGVPWRQDLVVMHRLPEVERLHLSRQSNRAIASTLGVDEGTIRSDLKHLQELWLEQIGSDVKTLRSQVAAELVDLKSRALAAAAFDELCERAVLFGVTFIADGKAYKVQRDERGSAQFRGNKAASLNVARQAVMDRAKILGVVIEKNALTDTDGGDIPLGELMGRFANAHDRQAPTDPGGTG